MTRVLPWASFRDSVTWSLNKPEVSSSLVAPHWNVSLPGTGLVQWTNHIPLSSWVVVAMSGPTSKSRSTLTSCRKLCDYWRSSNYSDWSTTSKRRFISWGPRPTRKMLRKRWFPLGILRTPFSQNKRSVDHTHSFHNATDDPFNKIVNHFMLNDSY